MLHQNSYNVGTSGDKSGDKTGRSIKFTDVTIRHLKPTSKKMEYSCEGLEGFKIRVLPSGTKTWLYTYTFSNKRRKMSLGRYPKVSLSQAMILYQQALEKVENGVDPLGERQKEKQKDFDAMTVARLVELYLEFCEKSGKQSYHNERKCFKKDLLPYLGKVNIKEVEPKHLSKIFHRITVERNAPSMAKHLYSYTRRLFNFAADMGLMRRRDNPCLDIKLSVKNNKRSRHLNPKEIYLFWYGLDHIKMSPVTRLALRFMLVTVARGGEVRQMKWSDIDFQECIWTLPKTKNGHLHRIYLGEEAFKILDEVSQYSDGKGYVFGSAGSYARTGKVMNDLKPLSGRTLCQPIKRHFEVFGIEKPFIPHDLRRTGATIIAGLFGRQDLVKLCLNHVRGDVTAIYDQYTYGAEKKRAMEALNKAIRRIISSANIESVPTFDDLKEDVFETPRKPIVNHSKVDQNKQGLQASFSNPVTYKLSFDRLS
ncbi:site-specific integrase [uncultured Dokdonia sp.]|uniref:tyrosine-type recombinase/integrase n=1 Tax=uncultured Dokdonia sp. TaxID=575653 RepID=UPI00260F1261|nr:site-specific integrase [uncultured Dokdonia sp.]